MGRDIIVHDDIPDPEGRAYMAWIRSLELRQVFQIAALGVRQQLINHGEAVDVSGCVDTFEAAAEIAHEKMAPGESLPGGVGGVLATIAALLEDDSADALRSVEEWLWEDAEAVNRLIDTRNAVMDRLVERRVVH